MPPDATGGWDRSASREAAFFLAVLTTLTFTVPNLSPVDKFVSDYANSSWAALDATAILIHVARNTAIAVALAHIRPLGTAATIG